MTDLEFVQSFMPELTEDYQQLKQYAIEVPSQALIQYRSLLFKLTDSLSGQGLVLHHNNLYQRIEALNEKRVIDVPTVRLLHKLRNHANRGAHPERYHLQPSALLELAEKALQDLHKLLARLYQKRFHQPPPAYQIEQAQQVSIAQLCYQAVMHDQAQAQYELGIIFKTQGLMAKQQASADEESQTLAKAQQQLQKADYWFNQAKAALIEARFEAGVASIHGYNGQVDLAQGEAEIKHCAEAGVDAAQALLGYFYLTGSESYAQDYHQARTWLSLAAEAGDAEAMSNLGVLYYQQQDWSHAFQWTQQAATQGFPNAQYHLALMWQQGEGCEIDLAKSQYWLKEAAQQEQADAMLLLAQQYLYAEQPQLEQLQQAEKYLRNVIRYERSVPAMLELSTALADGILGRIDVLGAAALLSLAQAELAKKATTQLTLEKSQVLQLLKQSLIQQIENVLSITEETDSRHTLKRALQLLNADTEC